MYGLEKVSGRNVTGYVQKKCPREIYQGGNCLGRVMVNTHTHTQTERETDRKIKVTSLSA